MTHVVHRQLKTPMPRVVSGEGIYLTDESGKRYIDGCSGAAVSSIGHQNPKVIAAIKAQLDRITYGHSGFFASEPTERLADFLAEVAPGDLEYTLFVQGGSEAIEAALKFARQYFIEIGDTDRQLFIGRRHSYHGNTYTTLAIGDNWRRWPYASMLMPVKHIDACFPYREQRADETLEEYGQRTADELEAAILELGPGKVAAFIAETVVGGSLGAQAAAPGYFKRVREICDRYGVLLILDEVLCGMGRTGTLFACEQEGITPDIAAIAKGLGGGYQPIGGVIVTGRIYDALRRGSGASMQGHTYMGHAAGTAAALAVQSVIREENLLANVRARGTQMMDALKSRFGNHPYVGDVRGRGLLQAVEFVADRSSKEPFDPKLKLHARVRDHAFANGLMTMSSHGFAAGAKGDHVMLAPPFIVTPADVEAIVDRLGRAVDSALADVGYPV